MKRSPLKKFSKKMSERMREYSRLRIEFLRENPFCKPCADNGKQIFAGEIHHMRGRGKRMNELRYFLAVCRNCHYEITRDPKTAMRKGYSLDRIGI